MGWIIWISPPFIPNRYQALLTISSFLCILSRLFFLFLLSWVFFLCLLSWVFPFALYLGWVCLLASILGVISLPSNLGANSILAVFFFAFYHGCYFSLPFISAVFSLPSISAVFSLTSILVGCICKWWYMKKYCFCKASLKQIQTSPHAAENTIFVCVLVLVLSSLIFLLQFIVVYMGIFFINIMIHIFDQSTFWHWRLIIL